MLLKDFLPQPQNRELVRLYRIIHLTFDKKNNPPPKAYPPRPEHVLSFFPRETEKVEYPGKTFVNCRCVLTGQHNRVFHRSITNDFLCLQIVFQPTGFFRLTGVPSCEFCNEYLDGELFFSQDVRNVNEQLFHALTYDAMLIIADSFVNTIRNRIVKSVSAIDPVSKLILRQGGNISLNWLAKESSLSIKQFERNFSQRTGITPKIFCRVTRFDKAFRLKNEHPEMDWLSIAIACGYYDYQHLAKDYKEFTSLTPLEFHILDNKAPERTFGLHEGSAPPELI